MPFQIIRNDITKVQADAIVNTANPHPIIGSGTDSAIHEAAGPELLNARKKIGDILPGAAVSTPAFNLPAKYVIHTVGPSWVDGKYADMGEIWFLKEPIDISEFKKYVTVSNRGAITLVYGKEYAGLKSLIIEKNQNPPEYFISSVAADAESSRINRYNWLRISYEFRHILSMKSSSGSITWTIFSAHLEI